jgi:hypothetical protein
MMTEGQTLLLEVSKVAKLIKLESTMVVAKGWEKRKTERYY